MDKEKSVMQTVKLLLKCIFQKITLFELFKSTFISPRGTISSKRLTGFLMITLAGVLITYATLNGIDLNVNITGLIRDMIYGGVALVGSTIFEKKFKERKNETQ